MDLKTINEKIEKTIDILENQRRQINIPNWATGLIIGAGLTLAGGCAKKQDNTVPVSSQKNSSNPKKVEPKKDPVPYSHAEYMAPHMEPEIENK
jgi:hypothetical protein